MNKTVLRVIMVVLALLCIAAKDHKPRRGKHYIPSNEVGRVSTEELQETKVEEEKSFFDEIKNSPKLKPWINWWRSCTNEFSIDDFVDAGVSSLGGEWKPYDKSELEGPNKEFILRRSGKAINPTWGRLRYVRKGKIWQAEMRNPFCGVMLYEGNKARKVIRCGELDGVDQGFWVNGSRFVVTAYRKMSPEMSAECKVKEVGQCVASILWLVDLKKDTVWEYRGPTVTFKRCEPNDFLVKRYPEFFVQEGSKKK